MEKYSRIDNPEVITALFKVPSEPLHDCPEFAEDVEFTVSGNNRLTCRFFPAEQGAPTLLYFPDSMASIKKYDNFAEIYTRQNINFLIAPYRGYGKNSGKPGIASMMEDAEFILQETVTFLKEKNITSPLFVMGTSLGSACAIDIASSYANHIKGMIIESGFCDTLPFLTGLGLDITRMSLTEDDGFNHREKIEKIDLPTLILHGSRDTVVPPAQAEILQANSGARNKQFHIIPGANRETLIETGGDLYFLTIKTFVDTVSGINTWRQKRRKHKK